VGRRGHRVTCFANVGHAQRRLLNNFRSVAVVKELAAVTVALLLLLQ
jgi:hypothetical protein